MQNLTSLPISPKGPFGSTLSWDDLWSNKKVAGLFDSSYTPLSAYVWLSRNTESPRQYHLWSLLSLASALFSNHAYVGRGIGGRLKLNLGIILIGRPAIRKGSAINFMQRFATELNVNYGPTDTAGARHGIMAQMQSRWQDDIRDDKEDDVESPLTLAELGSTAYDSIIARMGRPRTRPSSIYFASKELGRLLTAQTRELLDFFADGLDGESIFYQTKNGNIRIPAPLINLLGATTPGNLPTILPRDAHDHGLLSRLIFVYAGKSEGAVPIPPAITAAESERQSQLLESLIQTQNEAQGEIRFSQDAEEEYRRLYGYNVATLEFRLNAYSGRRSDHLAKLGTLICLLRAESPYIITRRDIALAHLILILTETSMDGAYMGLDRSSDGKVYAHIREIIESAPTGEVGYDILGGHLARSGLEPDEAVKAIQRLIRSHRLVQSNETKISLGGSLGLAKAANYCNDLWNRLGLGG